MWNNIHHEQYLFYGNLSTVQFIYLGKRASLIWYYMYVDEAHKTIRMPLIPTLLFFVHYYSYIYTLH